MVNFRVIATLLIFVFQSTILAFAQVPEIRGIRADFTRSELMERLQNLKLDIIRHADGSEGICVLDPELQDVMIRLRGDCIATIEGATACFRGQKVNAGMSEEVCIQLLGEPVEITTPTKPGWDFTRHKRLLYLADACTFTVYLRGTVREGRYGPPWTVKHFFIQNPEPTNH